MTKKVDPKIRRILLKPLSRHTQRALDRTAYLEALRRLDGRAISENVLQQLRRILSSARSISPSKRWKDPVNAARQVAFAKALYASRRVSLHEYVVFAVFPVEAIHEGRWFDGHYEDELSPISEAIKKVEEDYGLDPNESWPHGQGPKEHIRLNRQYNAILDAKFVETLREFGLNDLANLKERSPKRFEQLRERGRRSVFHKDEYILAIQDVIIQYEKEAHQAAVVGAYLAAVTSLGAGVEGLLLLRCLRSLHKASRISERLPRRHRPRFPDDPGTWAFEVLIKVCLAAGWLPPIETSIAKYDTAALAHVLRRMRNYVHPGKRARERPWFEADEQEYRDAEDIYRILISTLGHIRRR